MPIVVEEEVADEEDEAGMVMEDVALEFTQPISTPTEFTTWTCSRSCCSLSLSLPSTLPRQDGMFSMAEKAV